MRRELVGLFCAGATALSLGAGVASAEPAPGGPPCEASARACLDLSDNQAWLMDGGGGVTYGPTPVTVGMPGAETPAGTFQVLSKDKDFWSTEFDAPMPNSVFFVPGIAFHEGSLERQSNGCVHLSQEASQQFFDTLQPGDEVQVVP